MQALLEQIVANTRTESDDDIHTLNSILALRPVKGWGTAAGKGGLQLPWAWVTVAGGMIG